jgi:hypothetical protein
MATDIEDEKTTGREKAREMGEGTMPALDLISNRASLTCTTTWVDWVEVDELVVENIVS